MRRAVALLLVGCLLVGWVGACGYLPGRSENQMATSVAAQQTMLARQTSVAEGQTAQPSSGATDGLAITSTVQPAPGTQVPPSGTASPAVTGVATPPAGTPSPVGTLGSLPEDIPVPDDAQKLLGGGLFGTTLFAYTSDRAPAEVASFYAEAMPELGWTNVKAEGSPPQYRFEYAKGDRTIVVEIDAEPETDKTLIAISAGGPE